jgi:hypothetical protein
MMRLYRVGLFTDVYFPNPNGVTTSVYLLKELKSTQHKAYSVHREHLYSNAATSRASKYEEKTRAKDC